MIDAAILEKMELLQRVELFSTLAQDELEIVAYHAQMAGYRRGSLVFTEESPGNELYVIKDGEVLITKHQEEGDVDIAQYIAGESFGEWDFIAAAARNATAVAVKDSILLVFPREGMTFTMFLQKYPRMSARMLYKLLAIIARRIRTTQRHINDRTPWIQNLRKQVYADKLTGLFNRHYLIEEISAVLAARPDRQSSLLFIKPDNFKEINDRFGHDVGDRILILISIFIQSSLRDSDIAVRYGGDEFAVLLPGADRDEGINAARELGASIYALDLKQSTGVEGLRMTVSIGIAVYPEHGTDADTLAAEARKKMMIARAKGGNRIIAAS